MKEIPLTRGQVTLVDDGDFEFLTQWKWSADWAPCTKSFYAIRNSPTVGGKRHLVYMHREILGLQFRDSREGHHINHETLDNRRCNLQIVTRQQNRRDQKLHAPGVSYCPEKKKRKFRSRIMVNRHIIQLGYFITWEEAHACRVAARERYRCVNEVA